MQFVSKDQLRKASPDEIAYYAKFLYPFQDEIFDFMKSDQFYLGGGTCLSRFYYDHRFSDDLDFFFNGYDFPKDDFNIIYREVVNRIHDKFQLDVQIDSEYFKRITVYKNNKPLKLEFIFENYKCPGSRIKSGNIWIDSKENIATNKITAIYDRKTVKDYVDLYYLLPEFSFEQLEQWAEFKIVPMEYEGILITFSNKSLEGTALLKKNILIEAFNEFCKNLVTQIFKYAKTKTK